MKCLSTIFKALLPAILLCISGNIFSKTHTANDGDWLLDKLFHYKYNLGLGNDSIERYAYMKHTFMTKKRNPTLFLVPTMYSIAKGHRDYIRETFGKITMCQGAVVSIEPWLTTGTIRKNRKTMPIILYYITPTLYSECLFGESVLSPFYSGNKDFYNYNFKPHTSITALLEFTPRINNTQLVNGWAIIDNSTGRIISTEIKGVFDMITFELQVKMKENLDEKIDYLLPQSCSITSEFNFLGNKIDYLLDAIYSDETYDRPDTIYDAQSQLAAYRPVKLSKKEKDIYSIYNSNKRKASSDTISNTDIAEKTINIIEDNLLSSIRFKSPHATFKMSPLLDPLQLSYSNSRGLSYRMKIDTKYSFSDNRFVTFKPRIGYNFKINKFFYSLPLKYFINEESDNWVELSFSNNRISNSTVKNVIKDTGIDTLALKSYSVNYFNDQQIQVMGNIPLSDQVSLTLGCVYHNREAVNKQIMNELGLPSDYKSFSPIITLGYRKDESWPMLTASYERSIKGILKSNLGYERWELDASYKKNLSQLRKLSLRFGGGLYTSKSSDYFLDYDNFRENYLPEGWDDDWTGRFQLLNSSWYNNSEYYVKLNASYESPLMIVSRLPIVGKYIETERIYCGVLGIQHTRPYSEIGYGFTNRYFSMAAFSSFLNGSFQEIGCKFTFELFSRW